MNSDHRGSRGEPIRPRKSGIKRIWRLTGRGGKDREGNREHYLKVSEMATNNRTFKLFGA